MPPDVVKTRRRPPAALAARSFTLASPFLPILLPAAWYFQHRAFEQASSSIDHEWPDRWWNRPLVVVVTGWLALLVVGILLYGLAAALGQDIE